MSPDARLLSDTRRLAPESGSILVLAAAAITGFAFIHHFTEIGHQFALAEIRI